MMSYIRSNTNSEQIYIWSNGENVTFVKGPYTVGSMPTKLFDEMLHLAQFNKELEFNGAKAEFVYIGSDGVTHKKFKDAKLPEIKTMIRLSYDKWVLDMWFVTWCYIITNNCNRHDKTI